MRSHLIAILLLSILSLAPKGCGSGKRPNPPTIPGVPTPEVVATPEPTPTPEPQPSPTPTPVIEPSPLPSPTATPSPSPDPSPSPTPEAKATPFPTPVVNLADYGPKIDPNAQVIGVVGNGNDVGPEIQKASDKLDGITGGVKGLIEISGHGIIQTRPITNHHLIFAKGAEFRCDQQDSNFGCMILKDGVAAIGNGATIYEPTFGDQGGPAYTVFQSYSDFTSIQHEKVANRLAVTGFNFKGGPRGLERDGGSRATIQFGNCHNCIVSNNSFDNTSGIGVNWGGSPNPGGAYAFNSISYKNSYSGNVAAAEAIVNGQNILLVDITCKRPARLGFSGGVSCVDVEPNVGDNHEHRDRTVNIGIYNIDCDYTGAGFNGAGNCVNIQNPNSESDVHDVTVANVIAWGGDPADTSSRPLSNGIFVNGFIPNLLVSNVKVTKAGQSCVMIDKGSGNSIYRDVTCISSGGHGHGSITLLAGTSGVKLERIKSTLAPNGKVFGDARIVDCGSGNSFEQGVIVSSEGCAGRGLKPDK